MQYIFKNNILDNLLIILKIKNKNLFIFFLKLILGIYIINNFYIILINFFKF